MQRDTPQGRYATNDFCLLTEVRREFECDAESCGLLGYRRRLAEPKCRLVWIDLSERIAYVWRSGQPERSSK